MLPRMSLAGRSVVGLRHLVPVALCALGGHLVVYCCLKPAAGNHAYFAWYELLVICLSLAFLVSLAVLLLTALLGRADISDGIVRLLSPASARTTPVGVRAVRLAMASVAFLLVQESLERSISTDRLTVAAFSPAETLLLLLALGSFAGIVALVERSCVQLIELAAAPRPPLRGRASRLSAPHARPARVRRRNPLADLRGLRAPPLSA